MYLFFHWSDFESESKYVVDRKIEKLQIDSKIQNIYFKLHIKFLNLVCFEVCDLIVLKFFSFT